MSGRKVGTAVLLAHGRSVTQIRRLDADARFHDDFIHGNPFETIMVDVEVPRGDSTSTATFISAQAPPATRIKAKKPGFATALDSWIAACPHPVVLASTRTHLMWIILTQARSRLVGIELTPTGP